MALKVSYLVERGNTVPYPPLFDEIRRNHGFTDLRARPELVEDIAEVAESPALKALLADLAQPGSALMTLGCDLGAGRLRDGQLDRRWRVGGYVQVALLPLRPVEPPTLHGVAKRCERHLEDSVGSARWDVNFGLCESDLVFDEKIETYTLWIWVHAMASTFEKGQVSRECLLTALHTGLSEAAGLVPTDA
jgi:hypothetical protein